MRRVFLFFFVIVSACSPAPVNPYYMIQAGEDLQNAGNAAILATQQARHEQAEQLSMVATSTADAQSAQATSQALKAEHAANLATITADAHLAQIAQITARAVEANATQASYLTGLSLSATQTTTAILLETERLNAERTRSMVNFYTQLIKTALSLLVFSLVGFVIYILWTQRSRFGDWLDWMIEWRDRRSRLYETRSGTVMVAPNRDGTYTIQLVNSSLSRPGSRNLELRPRTEIDGVQSLTPSGSVLMSPLPKSKPNGVTTQVIELIEEAVRLGWTGDKLPGHRDLENWSGPKWDRVIAALKKTNAVETSPEGTFVSGEYQCTLDLLEALQAGKLKIRPAPTPEREVE